MTERIRIWINHNISEQVPAGQDSFSLRACVNHCPAFLLAAISVVQNISNIINLKWTFICHCSCNHGALRMCYLLGGIGIQASNEVSIIHTSSIEKTIWSKHVYIFTLHKSVRRIQIIILTVEVFLLLFSKQWLHTVVCVKVCAWDKIRQMLVKAALAATERRA